MGRFTLRHNGTFFYIDVPQDGHFFDLEHSRGFRYHQDKKIWYTPDYRVALRLREYASKEAEKILSKAFLNVTPWTGAIPHPPYLTPMYYQIPATRFTLERPRSALWMAAGLGKTPCAAMAMNALTALTPVDYDTLESEGCLPSSEWAFVYICPPFLTRNVENELEIWSPSLGVDRVDEVKLFGNVMMVPSSQLTKPEVVEEIKRYIKGKRSGLYIDEAHQFKNEESERTRALYGHEGPGIVDLFDRVTLMTGDMMPNRPLELYPALSKLAPDTIDFMTRDQFGMKFCAGRFDGYGYDFSGGSNIEELARRIHGKFTYRLKKDALDLPPLREEVFVVAGDLPTDIREFEHGILKVYSPEDLVKGKIESDFSYANMPLPTYQRFLGMKKVPYAVEYVKDFIENTDESILIFARHRDVVQELYKSFHAEGYFPVVITGDIPAEKRFDLVKQFQKSTKRRVMLGNLKAMGLGLNITKATRVLNVEPFWTPTDNNQGRDRAHRLGQTRPVLVHYLVYRHSVDHQVLKVCLRKEKLGSYI